MPAVSEQFKTFYDFASADLDTIYGERLKQAYMVKANHLESGVWINQSVKGNGIQFIWQPLPWEAQLSPINAIVADDFNGDGASELILATNHFTNWPETGLWRGTPGCHLEWNASTFTVIPQSESGITLPNDTKSILSIDTNGDHRPDILAGQNDDQIILFKNQRQPK